MTEKINPTIKKEYQATILAVVGVIIGLFIIVVAYMINDKPKQATPVYNFKVEPGKNGVIQFHLDEDSLATVTYIFHGDTIKAKNLYREEFDSLVKRLYPDTIYKETNINSKLKTDEKTTKTKP